MQQKPRYSTTKRYLWLSSALAWIVILSITAAACMGSEQAVRFGDVTVPAMVGLIVGCLGVHRGFGSYDMAAMMRGSKPDPPEDCGDGGRPQ
ncbi:NAD(P)+ transhydrogenase beta chain [Oryzifoliimicrobium ureilyticus]|uniref:NAD(P)+ transhydrogenase beta chain n=1 Tax=Oryzifoliimicrobium ureilyticus TaxID=3113724 RepID=UPI0030767CA3